MWAWVEPLGYHGRMKKRLLPVLDKKDLILSKEESARLAALATRPADSSGERYRRSMRAFADRKASGADA